MVGYFRTADFGSHGPHKALLDKAVNDRPVAIMGDCGHSEWLNSKALEVMGIDRNTPGLAFYQRDRRRSEKQFGEIFAVPFQSGRNPTL